MKKTLRWKIAQSAEIRWWQSYLKNKPQEHYLNWKKKYWEKFLDSITDHVSLKPGDKFLDAGCGPAGIFIALDNYEGDALDPLMEQYKQKIPHFKPENYPKVNFINAPLENIGQDKQYDVVFCLNAINHVNDLNEGFKKISSAVKSGGYLVYSTDAHRFSLLKKIFQLIPGDILHPHQYDIEEYEEMTGKDIRIISKKRMKREWIFDYWLVIGKKVNDQK